MLFLSGRIYEVAAVKDEIVLSFVQRFLPPDPMENAEVVGLGCWSEGTQGAVLE